MEQIRRSIERLEQLSKEAEFSPKMIESDYFQTIYKMHLDLLLMHGAIRKYHHYKTYLKELEYEYRMDGTAREN